ncbi:flagellar biosynthesis anti-sigma factor FlgM [Paenibacillus radicis (ex Xue et al. 2023)]|uniref:Negative regulator of flagellin synthesis n=1 Tax=Paenibacillus radicis (ex Xue et al. 2023) TaxID=2972489 RepID=A0ABT1YGP8_9BACL|nr:flagellar biosynthesis anti-sigma factor FlgM [Paenibacillus radicis (ex Xue et al. 2023)]MCR8632364.1 flagellar biosynthesis anti-sigma factor FlgM [Paenibacillus radicis (ex Xue et al. 2023)]
MKINGTNRVGAVNQYQKNHDAMSTSAAGKTGKKKDQVQISSEAKELLGSNNSAAAEHSKEQIDSLKSSVAAGTYKVDSRSLAEKLFPFIK